MPKATQEDPHADSISDFPFLDAVAHRFDRARVFVTEANAVAESVSDSSRSRKVRSARTHGRPVPVRAWGFSFVGQRIGPASYSC